MFIRFYSINNRRIAENDPYFHTILDEVYSEKTKLYCCCLDPAIKMYLAKRNGQVTINRMPNTGSKHHPDCKSFEIPPELSGLSQVNGSAIKEDTESGTVTLKLEFILSKQGSRKAPIASGLEHDTVKTDGKKLTLRSTLHYLWDQAELNKWYPAMAGKRNWSIVRYHLLEAAKNKLAKGCSLDKLLYIPETFFLEKKGEITTRRLNVMKHLIVEKGAQPFMIMVAELKGIEPSKGDFKVNIKHCPNFDIYMNADMQKRLASRFHSEFELHHIQPNSHLLIIGTFGISTIGHATFQEAALFVVNENWLPYESVNDLKLIEAMTLANHRFIKALRYNLPSDKPIANLIDTTNGKTKAMYIINNGASEDYKTELDALIKESELEAWLWDAGVHDMPKF